MAPYVFREDVSIALRFAVHAEKQLFRVKQELGIWIGVPYWGNEYGLEASEAVIQHGFRDLGLTRIYVTSFTNNENSERLQQKLGFRYRKTIEEYYCPQLEEYRAVNLRVVVNPELEI